eukprot:1161488-Pelagomonas_calceolata.AAC.6
MPVGLWAQPCSSTMEPSGAASRSAIMPWKSRPTVSASKYLSMACECSNVASTSPTKPDSQACHHALEVKAHCLGIRVPVHGM